MSIHNIDRELFLSVRVDGQPVPQGSLQRGGRGQMFYSNGKQLNAWRDLIKWRIQEQLPAAHEPLTDPIGLDMWFEFTRPQSRRGQRWVVVPPDSDKLIRAVGDACTKAELYDDDKRVVQLFSSQEYAESPGLDLFVYRLL